ncbi:recombinase family protein [Gemmatimonadota bacterium]
MITAVGYIRVSTVDQAVEGVSLASQRERIQAWAKAHDSELINIYEDAGLSGKSSDNRPGLQKALQAASASKAALVVYSLSRMSRCTRDTLSIAERLEKAGADLVSLSENIDTTTAAGKMVFRMLAVLAEFERDVIAERTKSALAHLRRNGRKTGGDVPYGYDCVDGQLVENKKEARVIKLIVKLHRQGMNNSHICRELRRRHYKSKRGNAIWDSNLVARIISRTLKNIHLARSAK